MVPSPLARGEIKRESENFLTRVLYSSAVFYEENILSEARYPGLSG